ncbi:hypothetical protein F5890DRAFT_1005160 [Lentinula detonsa]|uniref:Uncharacterized protein n=1 Tax=Lentinula detonsa TaxID=2804962 RepID=A0AA38Q2Q1_9AGAR|nr:hypothetical protein F5890DRAFT_1005160 [Lentinula detonsa]
MPSNSTTRTRNRSSSNAYVEHEPPPSNWNQYHTPLVNHVSAVHHPETLKTPPLRPASVSKSGAGMSAASRYAHNLKVLRRRDPSILRIFDQFSHVCIYHHNGQSWEKKGFEGSMFLYERADYPPYGFYILNRMGMDDYIQRLWPEDNLSVTGSYLMLRTWPEWSRNRIRDIEASNGSKELHPFDERYKWDQETRPNEATEVSKTIGLWMFNTDAREPLITVMLRLHGFIRQNLPYPEKYRYGPDKPPPPNSSPSLANGAPNRTASAASTESGASTAHTGSASTDSSSHSQQHSPNAAYTNPLLYQISDSASTASADPRFLNAFVETPKVKGKIRKRKGKREKLFAESGDVTPMANGSNQVSDLNILFAKLVQPSASTDEANAESGYGPALPMSRGPLIPESSMGNGSLSNPASNPISMAVAHPPPVDQTTSTKLTLEGLFASVTSIPVDHQVYDAPNHRNAEDGFNHKHHQRSSPHSHSSSMPLATIKTQAGNAAHYSASPVKNTGLALLNDIFASASTSGLASSIISPSDSILQENICSEIEHHSTSVLSTIATSRDEPETIEIYSPRPQAPLSLATMFDAAVCDGTRSPSGLGLDVTSIEQDAGREGHQTILTQRVLDTLLDTGGSMDPEHDDDVKANTPNTPSEMNAEPEEVRRRLLHMIGLGSSSHFPYSHPKSNGDVTPRAIHKETPEPATTSSFGVPESLQHSTSHTDVSFADTEDVFDEGDEDDEPIVELDFSDTRALSDIHVFENRERVLREQLIERKAASRNHQDQ